MLTTLIASIALAQGAGIVGWYKDLCELQVGSPFRGESKLAFDSYTTTETEVYKGMTLTCRDTAVGGVPRVIKAKGFKKAGYPRLITIKIRETLYYLGTMRLSDYNWFTVSGRNPTQEPFVTTRDSMGRYAVDREFESQLALEQGATEAYGIMDICRLDTYISNGLITGFAKSKSEIISWSVKGVGSGG